MLLIVKTFAWRCGPFNDLIDDVNPQIFGAKQVKARARGDRCVASQSMIIGPIQ